MTREEIIAHRAYELFNGMPPSEPDSNLFEFIASVNLWWLALAVLACFSVFLVKSIIETSQSGKTIVLPDVDAINADAARIEAEASRRLKLYELEEVNRFINERRK